MRPQHPQSRHISRRHFLASASFAATAAALRPRTLFAQAKPASDSTVPPIIAQARASAATTKVIAQPLRGNVSILRGEGGNMACLQGKDGALLVDSSYATAKPNVLTTLDILEAGPPKHLINTHWHFDHTDGNEWMHNAGATILAHDNTKKDLATSHFFALFNQTIPAAPAAALPTETFADKKTLHVNGATLQLEYYGPAHTDSDISIYFTEADILHCGDTFFNGMYPVIDYATGGSIDGMIKAAARNLALAGPNTYVIPGHGPLGHRADLQDFYDIILYARNTVQTLKSEGKTLAEVQTLKPLGGYDIRWGKGGITPDLFLSFVYQGV